MIDETNQDRVWCAVNRKVRIADYENFDISVGMSASVPEGKTRIGTLRKLQKEVLVEYVRFRKAFEDYEGSEETDSDQESYA